MMRIKEKRDLLTVLDMLKDAIIKMGKKIEKNDRQLLISVLEECQQVAIEIGTTIEKSEGNGTKTVNLLEELCELMYYCSISENDALRICKQIEINLDKIKDSIETDIKERRKKIVFLPYKAAMWDSLESVWMAAKEDESCDVYVMPIPYYDKNQDGSFGVFHDEKDLFPAYVPITDWRNYDLNEEHPDIIFIHNPYDETNYVTSIHPKYYSDKLKECTDMLVYIPYFVSTGMVREHLCIVPAVFNADKVVVQEGRICETYKRIYVESVLMAQDDMSEEEKEQSKMGLEAEAENKFLGMGSPKLDRSILKKYDIPVEWQRLIGIGDARKKVVLFNTHLSSIMKNKAEYFLEDIDRILGVFKEEKKIVLLWRPHPLIEATINSMNPDVKDRYRKVIEKYRSERWGIYDDTPEFERAVEIADAYYGDQSSLVEIFKNAGKPVMIRKAE